MKRSEMITTILDCIETYNPDCDMEFGDFLLTHIEKAGMLPPKAHIQIQLNGYEYFITDYCWEKENNEETK